MILWPLAPFRVVPDAGAREEETGRFPKKRPAGLGAGKAGSIVPGGRFPVGAHSFAPPKRPQQFQDQEETTQARNEQARRHKKRAHIGVPVPGLGRPDGRRKCGFESFCGVWRTGFAAMSAEPILGIESFSTLRTVHLHSMFMSLFRERVPMRPRLQRPDPQFPGPR